MNEHESIHRSLYISQDEEQKKSKCKMRGLDEFSFLIMNGI